MKNLDSIKNLLKQGDLSQALDELETIALS